MDNEASLSFESEIPKSVSLLVIGMLAGLGTLFFGHLSGLPISTYFSAKRWAETSCTILARNVERKESTATADRKKHDQTKYKITVKQKHSMKMFKHRGLARAILAVSFNAIHGSANTADNIAEVAGTARTDNSL